MNIVLYELRKTEQNSNKKKFHDWEVDFLNTDLLLKVAGIGILVTVAYQILHKSGRDEQAMLVTVAGIVVVMLMLVGEIGELFNSVRSIFGF